MILITYATLTGNTQEIATRLFESLSKEFPSEKFELLNIRDVKIKNLSDYKLILLGASSWTDPINPDAEGFASRLQKEKPPLSPVTIALFGLGDSQFEKFCSIMPLLKAALKSTEGRIYKDIYTIDGYPQDKHFQGLMVWAKTAIKDTF